MTELVGYRGGGSYKNRWHRRKELASLSNAPYGVGAYSKGSTLLIGEEGSGADSPDQEPFCSDKGCSGWLNKQLDLAQAYEEFMFWVNARNHDGSLIDLTTLVEQLQPERVIALGNVAKKLCLDSKIKFDHVPHPQYWKRFKSKEQYPLLNLVPKALEVGYFYCPYIPLNV